MLPSRDWSRALIIFGRIKVDVDFVVLVMKTKMKMVDAKMSGYG